MLAVRGKRRRARDRKLLDTLQAGHPNLKSIVIVGADNVIPMARMLDQTQQANELGFRSNFGFVNNEYVGAVAAGDLLTDDPYADPDPQPFLGGSLYVPKLALGRLVETPQDISRQLDDLHREQRAREPADEARHRVRLPHGRVAGSRHRTRTHGAESEPDQRRMDG